LAPAEVRRLIRDSERMIIDSLLRQRGTDWTWAPLVRFYGRVVTGSTR
jgi:hypothetical protein